MTDPTSWPTSWSTPWSTIWPGPWLTLCLTPRPNPWLTRKLTPWLTSWPSPWLTKIVRAVSHYCDAWIHMQGVIMNSAASDNHASLWCVASHNPIGDNKLINKDWANCLENQSYVFNWNIGIVALAPQRKSRIRNYIILTVYCYHHDHHDHHFDHDHWDRRDYDKIPVPTVSISKWIPRCRWRRYHEKSSDFFSEELKKMEGEEDPRMNHRSSWAELQTPAKLSIENLRCFEKNYSRVSFIVGVVFLSC